MGLLFFLYIYSIYLPLALVFFLELSFIWLKFTRLTAEAKLNNRSTPLLNIRQGNSSDHRIRTSRHPLTLSDKMGKWVIYLNDFKPDSKVHLWTADLASSSAIN